MKEHLMNGKIEITELPVTEAFLRQKRLIQDRGELALIEDGKTFGHLGYFSLKKGPGLYRGGHYHLKKVEHFYIIGGRVLVRLADLDTGERREVELYEGLRAVIQPRCAHRFEALEYVQVLEYYQGCYDPDDDIPYGDFRK